jgi:hypothetical protein
MRSFAFAALVGIAAATTATVFAPGAAPNCFVSSDGRTVIEFTAKKMPSFKCSHTGSECSCTNAHPTHHDGGCREFEHTDGTDHKFGDCTDAGLNHIDGGWSGWTYGTCSKSCGTGTQSMTRTCTNPAPFHNAYVNGAECTADGSSATSSQSCNTHECPSDGVWSGWTYGTCSTSCAAGTRTGTRTCQGLAHGGADCPGSATGSFACDHGPCPIHCHASAFSAWTTCTKSCGTGSQTRTRSIITHADHGGYVCPYLAETRNCNANACAIDGTWSSYTAYSTCSKSCDTGTQSRTRTCDGKTFGGKACVGSTTETRNCNTHGCPVNGVWSSWTYGPCSWWCNSPYHSWPTQLLTRTCTGVAQHGMISMGGRAPSNGGADCVGSASTTGYCNYWITCPDPTPAPAPWYDDDDKWSHITYDDD